MKPIIAEKVGGKWAVAGWRLDEVTGGDASPMAILSSQSSSINGKITFKKVCALNIRIVAKNGKLERINPYAI